MKINSTALFLLMLMVSPFASAGSAQSGKLRTVHFMNNGVVLAYTTGVRTEFAACATNQPARFAIDGTTPSGKVQLAGILAAYSAGKKVVIIGADNCSVYGDTETISYFYTDD